MIRLLMAIGFALVTTQASAQVQVPKSYVDGEVIHADELNTNLEAIAGAVPPRTCTTDQIIKWDGSAWVCVDIPADGADGATGPAGADAVAGEWVVDSTNNTSNNVVCTSPKKAISGGCVVSAGSLESSFPILDEDGTGGAIGWRCVADTGIVIRTMVFCQ